MNEPAKTETGDIGQTTCARSNLPRLRLPAIALIVYWTAALVAGAINKPYFFWFMYGALSTAILNLIILGWWWFNRAVRFREKLLGFLFMLGEAVIVAQLSHKSIIPFTL